MLLAILDAAGLVQLLRSSAVRHADLSTADERPLRARLGKANRRGPTLRVLRLLKVEPTLLGQIDLDPVRIGLLGHSSRGRVIRFVVCLARAVGSGCAGNGSDD